MSAAGTDGGDARRNGRVRLATGAATALAIAVAWACAGVGGCADGTTPDCSSPEAGCGPDVDASDARAPDAASDGSDDGESDAADAAGDAESDARSDAGDAGARDAGARDADAGDAR